MNWIGVMVMVVALEQIRSWGGGGVVVANVVVGGCVVVVGGGEG